jgi:hypothetical protein
MNPGTGEPRPKGDAHAASRGFRTWLVGAPHGLHLQTDAGGKFAMKDIDAGKYYFSVNRSGFVAANMTHAGPSVQALRYH